jgi:hypothetical protein
MSPKERRHALALYRLCREETHPASLHSFACQDLIRLQATTGLPWSVCLRLCHYARCRYWAWHYAETKQLKKMRAERRLMADDVQYFKALQQAQDDVSQLYV